MNLNIACYFFAHNLLDLSKQEYILSFPNKCNFIFKEVNKMEIKHVKIKIRDLVDGYLNDPETNQVLGFHKKLDIRPPYQREFVYEDNQRNEVIYTIIKKFPLNVMYWAKKSNDSFEIIDGQQRTISICQFINNEFSINYNNNPTNFHNLKDFEKQNILDYELDVYQCEGNDREKLEWFKIVNTSGEKPTNQELRNAVYYGTWLSKAKKLFSARNCAAYSIGRKYLKGSPIRQEFLEKALKWISNKENNSIEDYMAKHQNDSDCNELWDYFESVLNWVKTNFKVYRKKEMKDVEWGFLFNKFKDKNLNPDELESKISLLMLDDDVTEKSGIYDYILSGDERKLNIRKFTESMKRTAYERQKGKCPYCLKNGIDERYDIEDMDADHIEPLNKGGKTSSDNCQVLCKRHNRIKSDI